VNESVAELYIKAEVMRIDTILYLVLLWSGYFVIHSLLASLTVKQWLQDRLPRAMSYYRIVYNVVATLLLIFPVGFMIAQHSDPLWQWQGAAKWLANGVAITAIVAFFWTLRYYDMGEFTGIKQSRERVRDIHDQETFKISPLHRYVRHPWYSLALVIIWSRDMDYMYLTTGIMLSLYFFLGARLEEIKLLAYHGDRYRQYCEKVPGIIPRPWRYLTKAQALQLQSKAMIAHVNGNIGK
jgi:protein-S-isoprenylcysteine O-methyltransferase Ste14